MTKVCFCVVFGQLLVTEDNLRGLEPLNAEWVDHAMARTRHQGIILDMVSSESPVYGEPEGAADNGHFECVGYYPPFCFNQFGDGEGAVLSPGNVPSAEGWREALETIFKRYGQTGVRLY